MKIAIRSIEIRGYSYVTAATGSDQIHRWFLLCDRQANAAAPTLLTDYINPQTVNGLRALTQRKRFKIMLDKCYCLNASAEPGSFRNFHIYLKLRRPMVIEYNSADNGTVADIVSNSLYFVTLGSNNAGVAAGSCLFTVRVRYTDS